MSDRIMKTAADNVADTFNKSELKLSSDKQNVVDYMLFESEDEPSDIVKNIGTQSQMEDIRKHTGSHMRNSYYYMRKLAVGLMLMDYAMVDKKKVGGFIYWIPAK